MRFIHHLPADTWPRIRRSIDHLAFAPLAGQALTGDAVGHRYVLGPWSWMVVFYRYDSVADVVVVVSIRDGRAEATPLP